jgi:Ca-activated chloride channel family protein
MFRGWTPAGIASALALVSAPLADAQSQQPTFRAGIETVAVYATVQDDQGRLVPGLPRDAFALMDDGAPVELSVFSNEPQALTALLLLDMSASIAGEFNRVRGAARHVVDQLQPGDRLRIGTFGTEVALSPWLTGDKDRLRRVLDQELWPGGDTPLYAALNAGLDSLADERGRRVILTISDGVDSSMADRGRDDLRRQVERRALDDGFMIYAIGLEGPGLDRALVSLADRTGGGRFQLTRNADLATTMARVVDELRHQYMLGFVPRVLDGRAHRLEVRLREPRLKVRARQSYVPGARP